MRSCFRATPKVGAPTALRAAGARSARTRSSAGCACTSCVTPPASQAVMNLVKAAEEVGTIVAQAMGMLRPEPNPRVQADCSAHGNHPGGHGSDGAVVAVHPGHG